MIQKIDINEVIKNAGTIEIIRTNLPEAELNKKGLAGNSLINAFQSKIFSLKAGEIAQVGKITGLCVIRHSYSSSASAVVLIDNFTKSITQISGKDYATIPMKIMWTGESYNTELSIECTYSVSEITNFVFCYQSTR